MSPSIPFNSPFMSLSFSRYVRFIFHVCPFLSLPVISLRQSPLTPPVFISFPFMSLSVPLHVPFSSPSFPFHFPLLSCHVNFSSPACLSRQILACSLSLPGIFPGTKTKRKTVFSRSRKKDVKNGEFLQISGKRRQETRTSKEPAGGFEPGTPVLRHRLVERHQITARYVGDPPFTLRIKRRAEGGGGAKGAKGGGGS